MKTSTTNEPAIARQAPARGETMNGAEILVAAMEREGVEVIFAYPGGASMPMHQALTRFRESTRVLGNLLDRIFEEQVKKYTAIWNAPRPAEGVVAVAGPSFALPGANSPGTVESPRDPTVPVPALQSALGSVVSPPHEPLSLGGASRHHRRNGPHCWTRPLHHRPRNPRRPPLRPGWEAPPRHPMTRRHCGEPSRQRRLPQNRPRNPRRSLPRPRRGASHPCRRGGHFRCALRRRRVRPRHLDPAP